MHVYCIQYMPSICSMYLLSVHHVQMCLVCSLCACLVLDMSLESMYHPIGLQASHAVFTKEVFGLLGDMNDCPQVLIKVSCCPAP